MYRHQLNTLPSQLPNVHTLSLHTIPSQQMRLLGAMKLTRLSLLEVTPELKDRDILYLPNSLTTLDVHSSLLTDECIPALPCGLLQFRAHSTHRIQGDVYPWPPHLKCLKLSEHEDDRVMRGLVRSMASSSTAKLHIPPLIATLELLSCSVSDANFSRLSSPSSSCSSLESPSSSSLLSWIPFMGRYISISLQQRAWRFPPYLTGISIPSSTHITSDIIYMFPPTMLSITIANLELLDEDVKHLPPAVEKL